MRLALAVALLAGLGTFAAAKRYPGDGAILSFKVVSQTPSAWTSKQLFATFDALLPGVEGCGNMKTAAHTKIVDVSLTVATDRSISDVRVTKPVHERKAPDFAPSRACLTE